MQPSQRVVMCPFDHAALAGNIKALLSRTNGSITRPFTEQTESLGSHPHVTEYVTRSEFHSDWGLDTSHLQQTLHH